MCHIATASLRQDLLKENEPLHEGLSSQPVPCRRAVTRTHLNHELLALLRKAVRLARGPGDNPIMVLVFQDRLPLRQGMGKT